MVEWWPNPSVPVYVVCSKDGEGHSQTLHRNYLLPISPNLEQAKDDAPVVGVEQTRTSAPVPSVDSEPSESELSGMAMSGTTSEVVWTSLLHSDAAHVQHRTNFYGDTTIMHYLQTPACPASWICGLV